MNKLLIILIALVFFSCKKKEDPIEEVGNPVFTFSGEIDGTNINYIAGEDNMYMYASFEKDNDDIFYFTGDFGNLEGNSKLKIGFRDYKKRNSNESIDIHNVIKVGKGFYIDSINSISLFYKANFRNNSYSGSTYTWDFGDGSISTQADTGVISHLYSVDNPYNVSLDVSNGSCNSSIDKDIDFDVENCSADFSYIFTDSAGISFVTLDAIPLTGTGPFAHVFEIEGSTYNTSNAFHVLASQGIKKVNLIQDSDSTCISKRIKNIDASSTLSQCMSNFDYLGFEEIQSANTSFFNTIFVEWTDDNGIIYSTKYKNQNGESIEIISVEDYDNNEKGEKTRKIEIDFNCTLYNSTGSSIKLRNGKAVIAVALPN